MGKLSLKRVVFCEVAWMKYYAGVSKDDKPRNGGKFIKENGEGGEIFNFSPYNHKCYGYVMHYGDELHIERYDRALGYEAWVDGMTVIWVASDGKRCKIVGWYENATMYRYWQTLWNDGNGYDYHFIANERDCYLIDTDKRAFEIPRAATAGAGRGMGQSQVWYAESDYAQDVFLPKVMDYLNAVRNMDACRPFYFLPEELEVRAEDMGQTTKQLLEQAVATYNEGDVQAAMGLVNLAIDKDDCYATRFARADLLEGLFWYDEAEEELKQALYHKEDMNGLLSLMDIEIWLGHTFLAIELGEKIRRRRTETPNWAQAANNLVHLYINEGEFDKAQELMTEYEQEGNQGDYEWLEGAKEHMEQCQGQLTQCEDVIY